MAIVRFVGLRYLYSGKRDRLMMRALWLSLLCVAVGVVMVATGWEPRGGVVVILAGVISTVIATLLAMFSVFTSVSVLGVVFGVAALTAVTSVATGFEQEFREKVLGVNAHVIIQRPDFEDYQAVEDMARKIDPQVIGVQPFTFTEMLVSDGKGAISGAMVKGIDPLRAKETLDLDKYMSEGTVAALQEPRKDGVAPIILGQELARKLRVEVGAVVTVVVPVVKDEFAPAPTRMPIPRTRRYEVVGLFYSGFDEYDRRLMYVSLPEGQALLARGNVVSGVELKVRDVNEAGRVATKLRAEARKLDRGFDFDIKDWFELNRPLFVAVKIQKMVLIIILTLIVVVAAFNMVSSLTTLVRDKTREVAILKSMGTSNGSIAGIFLVVGTTIGLVGTGLGVALGLLTTYLIKSFGYRLDPKVYMIDHLPIRVVPSEVVMVAGITMVICAFAAVVPALKAASLYPVEGLRYD